MSSADPVAIAPSAPVSLTQELVRAASITPEDHGCQSILTKRLAALGFEIHDLTFGPVRNFFARLGTASPHVCFAGHTDVVPTGPESDWSTPPFAPAIRNGFLFGRGVADMKGALAAMLVATERYLADHPAPNGSISFLITGDEEGDAHDGTVRMVPWLQQRGELPDFCLVGEPSSSDALGDTIKNGRRGSLNGALTLHGVQGHVAFPDQAANPMHLGFPALAEMAKMCFDNGDDAFPATQLQFTNIRSGEGGDNVIPGHVHCTFNLRFSPQSSPESIDAAVRTVLDRHALSYDLDWRISGQPFITQPGALTDAMTDAVIRTTGITPILSTGGGTSDARFIAPANVAVAELGLLNRTIHKVDECAAVADIERLTDIYEASLENLLGD